jgi:tRNA(Ile)-lysidine synthase TilS/MesJ
MPTPITKKGYDALKAELDRLRKVERPQVIEAIAEARAHGDLSENAEYDAAKESSSRALRKSKPSWLTPGSSRLPGVCRTRSCSAPR